VTTYWKGGFAPFPTDTKCRPERSEGSPIIGKGKKTPFPTNPKKTLNSFGEY